MREPSRKKNYFNINKELNQALEALPYTFIEVQDKTHELYSPVPFNQLSPAVGDETTLTGELNCRLYALNPLSTGNQHKELNNKQTEILPLLINEKPAISPFTLKGCIASFLSMFLSLPMARVANNRFTFRPNTVFSNKSRIKTAPAIITHYSDHEIKALRIKQTYFFCYIAPDSPESVSQSTLSNLVSVSINELLTKNIVQKGIKNRYRNRSFYFFKYTNGLDGKGKLSNLFDDKNPNEKDKTLKIHNFFAVEKSSFDKQLEKLNKSQDAEIIINQRIINAFKKTREALVEYHLAGHPLLDDKKQLKEIKENIKSAMQLSENSIIFYEYDSEKNDECLNFGLHYYYRFAYLKAIHDFNRDYKPLLDGEFKFNAQGEFKINLLREMFGYSIEDELNNQLNDKSSINRWSEKEIQSLKAGGKAKSGKIHFNFATYTGGGKRESNWYLSRPGTPHASSYEFYLKQIKRDGKFILPLRTYGDPARMDMAKNRLAGRKVYRKSTNVSLPDQKDAEQQEMVVKLREIVQPVTISNGKQEYPCFTFKIRFENLRNIELALLLFALNPDNHSIPGKSEKDQSTTGLICHQIGYGKNYGMGAIQFYIDSIRLFRLENNIIHEESVKPGNLKKEIEEEIEKFRKMFNQNSILKQALTLTDKQYLYPGSPSDPSTTPAWHSDLHNCDLEIRKGKQKEDKQFYRKKRYQD